MTKLYISYSGDSVTIVEGSYKKNKFKIDDVIFMSSNDIDPDYSDKYNLLRYAIKIKAHKVKKAVLCLNTMDVIVKSGRVPKVDGKDLDAIMSLEIDELISLDREEYTFSYEVMKEVEEEGESFLDLALAGVETREVNKLIKIFEENNIKLECIDILPASYSRVLKEIEYNDIMIVNTGEHSTSIDIYKEDSLYIHDNVPVKITEYARMYEYERLVDEANGLMNYYSSRNFGKALDTILLTGEHVKNEELVQSFRRVFNGSLVVGIENLYDIDTDIEGDLQEGELNRIVDIIGCMMREKNKSSYSNMNLLPEEIKFKTRKNKKLVKTLKIAPLALLVLYIPVIALGIMESSKQEELEITNLQIEEIKKDCEIVTKIENDIKKKEQEIELYNMLIKKEPRWADILTSIDKNMPFKVQLDNLSISYVDSTTEENQEENKENNQNQEENKENNQNQEKNENKETENQSNENEEPIYNKVPNFITITGKAQTPSLVGQFLYNLKSLSYFEDIKLSGVTEQSLENSNGKKTMYSFTITAKIKDGVITSE